MPKANELILDRIADALKSKKDAFIGPFQTARVRKFDAKYPGGLYTKKALRKRDDGDIGYESTDWIAAVGQTPSGYRTIRSASNPYDDVPKGLLRRTGGSDIEYPHTLRFPKLYNKALEDNVEYVYDIDNAPQAKAYYPVRSPSHWWRNDKGQKFSGIDEDELVDIVRDRGVPVLDAATMRDIMYDAEIERIRKMKDTGMSPTSYLIKNWDELLEDY